MKIGWFFEGWALVILFWWSAFQFGEIIGWPVLGGFLFGISFVPVFDMLRTPTITPRSWEPQP